MEEGEFSEAVKILRPLKRITRRWALRQQRAREKRKAMATNSEAFTHMFVRARLRLFYFLFFAIEQDLHGRNASPSLFRSAQSAAAQGESGGQTFLRNASA